MSDKIPTRDVTPSSAETVKQEMYARRRHIYVREIKGLFQKVRRSANWALMLAFFVLPWVPWGDRPAVWFDLPGREFHILGATFYPQEFMLLSWLLIICAFGLFFITVFAGRVWCGYTCPQSVWTFLFIWVEHRLEGSRNRRIKLDRQPMNADKLWRKSAKHAIWLLIALATGITFVGYFTPIRDLVVELPTLEAHGWSYFWVGFFLVFTYLNAGWLREQVCIYMCPYARFQSVMFDRDTLIVSYDAARGEPRGARKKSLSHAEAREAGHGDCIDCDLCVQVCPTGIDIRDGLQYECISCAACIDACDSIMDQMNYPRGLIRYSTENAVEGKPSKVLRPRLIGYGATLTVMVLVFITAVFSRVPLELDIIRDRNALYRQTWEGTIENTYTLKIMNKTQQAQEYDIAVTGLDNVIPHLPDEVKTLPGELLTLAVTLEMKPEDIEQRNSTVYFTVTAVDDPSQEVTEESRFLSPRQ